MDDYMGLYGIIYGWLYGWLYGIIWDEWLSGWLYMDDYMGLYCLALWGFADSMDDIGWLQSNSEEDSRTNHFFFMAWDKGYLIQTGLLTMGELQCVFPLVIFVGLVPPHERLLGGFSTPLKNGVSSSVGMIFHSQHIWKVIIHSMVPVTTNQIIINHY